MVKKGFTMIELIIIFTIIMIMTAALMSTSYKDRARKEVEATARELVASIRETQNNALTGKQKASNELPCTFQMVLFADGYRMEHETRDIDGSCSGTFKSFFDKVQLPNDITIETIAIDANGLEDSSSKNIMFEVPYGGFMINNDKTYKGIEIIVKKADEQYRICAHSTGLIEETGFDDTVGKTCAF